MKLFLSDDVTHKCYQLARGDTSLSKDISFTSVCPLTKRSVDINLLLKVAAIVSYCCHQLSTFPL